MNMRLRVFHFLIAVCLLSATATAQTNSPANQRHNTRPENPQATASTSHDSQTNGGTTNFSYEFNQPEFIIAHIRIEHDGAGRGRIAFRHRGETESLTEPLEISSDALARITGLWSALGFLESGANYQTPRQLPHLGTVRLAVRRGEAIERTTEFNWTADRNAFALANEYRRLADQALFVFDINLARQNRPLETPSIMTRLELLLRRNALSDARQLVPLLRDLATDERLPLMARTKAEGLIRRISR
jgi:hypothetical protein